MTMIGLWRSVNPICHSLIVSKNVSTKDQGRSGEFVTQFICCADVILASKLVSCLR